MRDVLFLIVASFLIFLGVATFMPESSYVGSYGKMVGLLNVRFFGYMGYLYPFLLLVPVFLLYKDPKLTIRSLEKIFGFVLFVLSFLLIQSLIANDLFKGDVGSFIVNFLQQYIGLFGVWLFVLALFLLSISIAFGLAYYDFANKVSKQNFSIKQKTSMQAPQTIETEIEIFPKKKSKINSQKNTHDFFDDNEKKASFDENMAFEDLHESIDQKAPFFVEETTQENKENVKQKTPNKSNLSKKVEVLDELEENKKLLAEMDLGGQEKPNDYRLPPLGFLKDPPKKVSHVNENEIDQKIADLLQKLSRFNIDGDVVRTYTGPVVTTFEFRPAPHIKVSKILTLQDDLAMALKAQTIRIQAPIPGKDVVGIEIPNQQIETIYLKDVLESDIFKKSASPLTIVLGKDIVGNPFVTDLKKLPHLLIAGTTGSGKSVGINSMLISLLYRNSPDTLKLMMIDPKMLEFSIYNDIPHLITPVITQPKQAIFALANMVNEMERRYKMMSQSKTKNIEGYNEKAKKEGKDPLPYIVIIIDELADLMMTSGKDVEVYIARLAQMARASGIHLIVATQRPSVDVVTGLIKANLPSRISYKVGQKIDSKVILDSFGAESLLGRGDLLFTPPSSTGVIRLHAPFTSEEEIERIVDYLKEQRPTQYDPSFLKDPNLSSDGGDSDLSIDGELDELFEEAKRIVLSEQKSSISYIQRRLQIGYNRAARIVEQLEAMGILSAQDRKGQREIIQ